MSAEPEPRIYTAEEYLEFDRASTEKYEFVNGRIYRWGTDPHRLEPQDMSGGTEAHSLLAANVIIALGRVLRPRGCRVYTADMRVQVGSAGEYTYPDVSALCKRSELAGGRCDTLLNPSVIVEVLSASTQDYDRGEKFELYRKLPSLREYVLVAQDRVHAERRVRDGGEGNTWLTTFYDDIDDVIAVPSVDAALPLRDVYADVEFSERPRFTVVRETPGYAYAEAVRAAAATAVHASAVE